MALLLAVPVGVLLIAAGGADAATSEFLGVCGAPAAGLALPGGGSLSPTQVSDAGTILSLIASSKTPREPVPQAAIAAALVESDLVNVAHGTSGALGLFQETPEDGWGTPAQVMTPLYATREWLFHLPSSWAQMSPGELAQAVERSGYPARYQVRVATAKVIVAASCNGGTGSLTPGAITAARAPWTPPPGTSAQEVDAARFALAQLGKPYLYGGTGPVGYDCSGLTQAAWGAAGVAIARTTYAQVAAGSAVASISTLVPGDLVFIMGSDPEGSLPGHVGIYVGYGDLVDAPYSGEVVQEIPISDWAGQIVAMRHIA